MSPAAHLLRALVRGYQLTLSSVLGRECRFLPSCSEYAREALATHGAARGAWLALRRLVRCHPFAAPGYDPVPPARPAAASRPSPDFAPSDCTPSVCTSEHPCGTRRI